MTLYSVNVGPNNVKTKQGRAGGIDRNPAGGDAYSVC